MTIRFLLEITVVFLLLLGTFSACNGPNKPPATTGTHVGSSSPDSLVFGNITVYNGFQQQLAAFGHGRSDTAVIIDGLYERHRSLWDSCYGTIFGEENAPKFQTPRGMVAWNRELFHRKNARLDSIIEVVTHYDVDSLFRFHTDRFRELGYPTPAARITIAFTPFPGIGFGGCANDQFILELNNPEFELIYTLEKGLPHEIFHFINEEHLAQTHDYTALDLAINEGLACHFTQEYFAGTVSKCEAVENMSARDWQYYADREEEIVAAMRPFFEDTSGDNPLLQHRKHGIFTDAPRSLYYWLGYKIVESYRERHPDVSLYDLSSVPYRDIYRGSDYFK